MADQAQLPKLPSSIQASASAGASATAAPGGKPGPASTVPVVVKKYANRRLYNTETSSYITQDNLADMVKAGRDFVVYDARSGEDITRSVLTQIIVEAESKGSSMLPTPFLRHLIGFYGDSLQTVVPRYLEQAMATFAHQQQQMRSAYQQAMTPFLPFGIEEVGRQNMAIMERAMSLFSSFYRPGEGKTDPNPSEPHQPGAPQGGHSGASTGEAEMQMLKFEVERLQRELQAAKTSSSNTQAGAPAAPATGDKPAE